VKLSGRLSSSSDYQLTEFTCRLESTSPVSAIAGAGQEYVVALRAYAGAAKAGRYQIRLKEIRSQAQGDKDRILAERTLEAADQLRAAQKDISYRKAIEKYQEALVFLQAVPDHELEANALKDLGQTYQALNENKSAVSYYQQALAMSRKFKDPRSQAETLNCLSSLYVSNGNNREAVQAAESALRLSRLAATRSGEAQALFNCGEAQYGLGDLTKALEYYQQALRIQRALSDYQSQAEALLNIGYTFSSLSRTSESSDAYAEAVALSRVAEDPRLEAKSLRALATFQTRLGQYQQALDSFDQSLNSLKLVDDRLTKATVLAGKAVTYQNLGELQKALDFDNQAIALFQEIDNGWGEAEAQMDSGRASFAMGDGKDALVRYERALTLFRKLGITRLQAQTLRDMGLVYDSWNNRAEALNFYHQSLRLTRPGQDQRYQAYTLNYIGRAFERSGNKTLATDYYHRALKLNRVAQDPAGEALTLFNLAHVQRDLNHLDEALAQIEAALKISESLRSKVASHDVRASYVASTHQYFELHADVLMRLHQRSPNEGFAAAALEANEKARARSLLELLREAHADIREGVDVSLLDQERRIGQELNAKAERHSALVLSGKNDEAQAVAREIDQLTSDYEQIETQIRTGSPRYAALTQPQPLGVKDMQQQLLDNDSLFLEYMLGDERSYVWAVTPNEVSSFELPARAQIEEAALRFHKLLTANQPVAGETFEQHEARVNEANAQLAEVAASFSKLLLGPVMSRLGTKRLIIVPDGALQYIPFQALVVPPVAKNSDNTAPANSNAPGGQLVPLIVDHEIVNEPSASTLAFLLTTTKNRKPAPNTVAVLADPVFEADDPRILPARESTPLTAQAQETELHRAVRDVSLSANGNHIPRLLASREEADAIMSVAPWRSGFVAMDFEASRATVMNANLSDYRVVHFATHGLLNNDHPELSGIVLSLFDQKGKAQDGYLRLHDIYNLKLPVDLVVLSACNTGLGKDVRGEGLVGLTRGFMYAGASSVVASLWKVDDEATAELMRYFYGFMLKDGLAPAAALRKAQVAMSQQKRWQSPYYWSGFIIQGQFHQVESVRGWRFTSLVWWAGLPAILLVAVFFVLKRRRRTIL
jgi:CHAT domain-containing protein